MEAPTYDGADRDGAGAKWEGRVVNINESQFDERDPDCGPMYEYG